MTGRRLGLRTKLQLAVVGAVIVSIVGLTVTFNLVLRNRLNADANAILKGRAAADLAGLTANGGRLTVSEGPDQAVTDIQRWVLSPKGVIERPQHISPPIDRAALSLGGDGRRTVDLPASDTRLLAVPIDAGGRRLGVVVEGITTAAYEQTERLALISTIALGALLIALVAIAARWIVNAALGPVARMTESAADWSEHDLDRRFGLGPTHDEITQLAATLDGLLERIGASLRREQRFTAEVSHELRTPLARISAEAQLAARDARTADEQRAALEAIGRSAGQMQRTLDALLAAARAETTTRRATADAEQVARVASETCTSVARERTVSVDVASPPSPLRVAIEQDLAERTLAPVIENACRYAAHRVIVTLQAVGRDVVFTISDDGPGVSEQDVERIFEAGVQGAANSRDHPGATTVAVQSGAGLGLALSRRLARATGGDVTAAAAAGGCFSVRLPAA